MTTPEKTVRVSRPVRLLAALGGLLLFTACAPGMKLNMTPSKPEATYMIDGLRVTLRSVTPRLVQEARTSLPATAEYDELLAVKPTPYLIGPQDVLQVIVWEHPELTIPLGQFRTDAVTGQLVDEEGNIFWPYVGTLNVQGQTPSQVRAKLVDRMARVLKNPQVDVKVVAFRSQKIWVGGEVRTPGVYNVTDVPPTLAEVLGRAGGFLPTADDSRVALTRGTKTWNLDFHGLMRKGNRFGQILLKDGDHLSVGHREDESVYMLGEIAKPSIVPLRHGRLSLAQALAESGGMDRLSANAHSLYVLRRGEADGSVEMYHLDAHNPAAMVLADQFPLRPRDMVYVDAGSLVRWNRVVGLLLPTFTSLTQVAADGKYLK